MPSKTCYRCRQSRPLADFIAKRNGTYYDMCSACLGEILSREMRGPRKRLAHTNTHRIFYLCKRTLPNAAFTKRSKGNYFSACKDCNINVFAHRRRARMLAAEGEYTTAEWMELLGRHPNCPECSRRWEEIPIPSGRKSVVSRDHIVPVSKGGRNDIGNIQPLCYSCNSRKGDKIEAVT